MTDKEKRQQAANSLKWMKNMLVGNEEPKPHTYEFAFKIYLENAIELLEK